MPHCKNSRVVAKLNCLAMDHPEIRCAASIMERVERVLSAWVTDHLNAHRWRARSNQIMHDTHRQRLGSKSRRQAFTERRDAVLVHTGGLWGFWSRLLKAVSLSSWEVSRYQLGWKLSNSKAGSETSGTTRA